MNLTLPVLPGESVVLQLLRTSKLSKFCSAGRGDAIKFVLSEVDAQEQRTFEGAEGLARPIGVVTVARKHCAKLQATTQACFP